MPELDQATINEYGLLAIKLATNAKTRRQFIKAVKEVDPGRRFPDAEIEDLRDEMEAKREADRQAAQAEASRQRLEAARNNLITSGRYTDEQVKEIEARMEKLGLSDYEAGAILYSAELKPHNASNRPQPPSGGGAWELPKLDGLLEDPIAAARNQAFAEIDRINSARR